MKCKNRHLNEACSSQAPADNMRNSRIFLITVHRKLEVPKGVNDDRKHQRWCHELPTDCPENVDFESKHELDVLDHSIDTVDVAKRDKFGDRHDKRHESRSVKINNLKY